MVRYGDVYLMAEQAELRARLWIEQGNIQAASQWRGFLLPRAYPLILRPTEARQRGQKTRSIRRMRLRNSVAALFGTFGLWVLFV